MKCEFDQSKFCKYNIILQDSYGIEFMFCKKPEGIYYSSKGRLKVVHFNHLMTCEGTSCPMLEI